MFASKLWTTTINASLIAIIVFNALIPTTAIGMSLPKDEIVPAPMLFDHIWGTSELTATVTGSKSELLLQEETPPSEIPTSTPTEGVTETSTPEPTMTPTETIEAIATATPVIENTPTPSPAFEATATPSVTGTPTGTATIPAQRQPQPDRRCHAQ